MTETAAQPGIGVVVVAYNSADVIAACVRSLLASDHPALHVVVCDNASQDDTLSVVRAQAPDSFAELADDGLAAAQVQPPARLTLVRCGRNLGFAGGVNVGLELLRAQPQIELFWVLNPDCVVPPETAGLYAATAQRVGRFGLMGCRTVFLEPGDRVQTDGGRVSRWTGVCESVHRGVAADTHALPAAASLDYISGANMVASRAFLERAGPLQEDYFLYYEEVDWAFRRGDLPLVLAEGARVYHHGGTTIGSGTLSRRPSAFANYFNYRNRMRFLAHFAPAGLASAYVMSLARIAKLLLLCAWDEADGAARGLHGLPPPPSVRARIAPNAREIAFGPARPGRVAEQGR